MKNLLSWEHESAAYQKGWRHIAGIDEAGRGCLAGPVVAAAFIFLEHSTFPEGLNDSKKLSRHQRQVFFDILTSLKNVVWGVGIASVEEIDRLNILQATHLAMNRALENLCPSADFALVDGLPVKTLGLQHLAIVKGDSLSPSIAAASIIAKESRDRLMDEVAPQYPEYFFAQHKGYGTRLHVEAIEKHGITPLHRRSFGPVSQSLLPLG